MKSVLEGGGRGGGATGRQVDRQQNQWLDRWRWHVRVIRQRGGRAGAGRWRAGEGWGCVGVGGVTVRVSLTDGPFEPIL